MIGAVLTVVTGCDHNEGVQRESIEWPAVLADGRHAAA
jgi:hypothetical protein